MDADFRGCTWRQDMVNSCRRPKYHKAPRSAWRQDLLKGVPWRFWAISSWKNCWICPIFRMKNGFNGSLNLYFEVSAQDQDIIAHVSSLHFACSIGLARIVVYCFAFLMHTKSLSWITNQTQNMETVWTVRFIGWQKQRSLLRNTNLRNLCCTAMDNMD